MNISVTDPISRAIDRAALVTFKPFDIGKWFIVGFVAWLATLGEPGMLFNFNRGGGGGPVRVPTSTPSSGPSSTMQAWNSLAPAPMQSDEVRQWITTHLFIVVVIGLVLAAILLGVGLLFTWITSRGKFMFLRAIATNTAAVTAPWKQFRELGNSLFGFQVVLWGVGLAVNVAIFAIALLIAWDDIRSRTFGGSAVAALAIGLVLLLPASLFLGLVSWCTNNFVTVIMYSNGKNAFAAWREFRENIVRENVGKLILFFLLQIVLGIVVLLGRFVIGCATCCIGFFPYLSTVVALPLIVFMRCSSIYFLQQFGPQYVIIIEAPPPPRYAQ